VPRFPGGQGTYKSECYLIQELLAYLALLRQPLIAVTLLIRVFQAAEEEMVISAIKQILPVK
jgi:hypothetical protein